MDSPQRGRWWRAAEYLGLVVAPENRPKRGSRVWWLQGLELMVVLAIIFAVMHIAGWG